MNLLRYSQYARRSLACSTKLIFSGMLSPTPGSELDCPKDRPRARRDRDADGQRFEIERKAAKMSQRHLICSATSSLYIVRRRLLMIRESDIRGLASHKQ